MPITGSNPFVAAGAGSKPPAGKWLAARAGRSVFSLGPLLTGAAAGGLINRRETRKLGRMLRADLRGRSPHPDRWPPDDLPDRLALGG